MNLSLSNFNFFSFNSSVRGNKYKVKEKDEPIDIDRKIINTEDKLEKVFDLNFNEENTENKPRSMSNNNGMDSHKSNSTSSPAKIQFQRSKKPKKESVKVVDHIQANIDIDDTINYVKKALKNDEATRIQFFNKKKINLKLGKLFTSNRNTISIKESNNNNSEEENEHFLSTTTHKTNKTRNFPLIPQTQTRYSMNSLTTQCNSELPFQRTKTKLSFHKLNVQSNISSPNQTTFSPNFSQPKLKINSIFEVYKEELKTNTKITDKLNKLKDKLNKVIPKPIEKVYTKFEDNTNKKYLFSNNKRIFIYRKLNKDIIVSETIGDGIVVNTEDITADKTKKKKLKKLLESSDILKVKLSNLINKAKNKS